VIKLFHDDCLEIMPKLIEQGIKVDAIITDPPYGTTDCKWDAIIPFELMWKNLNSLIKENGAIVLFGSEPFSSALRMSNINMYRYDWIWKKSSFANFAQAPYMPLKVYETISVFSFGNIAENSKNRMCYYPQGLQNCYHVIKNLKTNDNFRPNRKSQINIVQTNTNYPKNVLEFEKDGKLHPTQKPLALMEYLIKTYTNEGETILDFTMGSGSTGVACKKLKRNFIGIELEEKYFKIAKDRISSTRITGGLM
jgi:site-specific DNA-methyltransferase (adenine-specific)